MADSVKTRIRKALKYQLGTIVAGETYSTTVGDIFDEGVSIEQIHNFPCIVIQMGDENTLDIYTQRQTFNVIHKRLDVYMYCFLYERNDMSLARELILADLEKLFGTYHSLPGSDNVDTCHQIQIVKSSPFGMKAQKPNGGIEIYAVIDYRQLRTDPSTKV